MVACNDGVFTGSSDKTIRKWHLGILNCTKMIILLNKCYSLALSADEKILVSEGLSKTVVIHDLVTNENFDLVGHSFRINSLSINGDYIVSGSNDHYLRVWSISKK
jgi:WD40 repeat protein